MFFLVLNYIYYFRFSNPKIRVILRIFKNDRVQVKSDMVQKEIVKWVNEKAQR